MTYLLPETPAQIAFSGGRTSGFMLWNFLQAHGGKLPEQTRVVFCNTGKEDPRTLDVFVSRSVRLLAPTPRAPCYPYRLGYLSGERAGHQIKIALRWKAQGEY